MAYIDRPRNYARDLSEAERSAVLDRNEYASTAEYPGDTNARWPARCLLCGAEVTVTLNNLVAQDDYRQWRSELDPEFSDRRTRCSHSGGNRGPRPLKPLRYEEARALLKLIGDVEESALTSTSRAALKKLRRIAGST